MIKTFATTMGLTAIMTLTAFADPISGKDAKKVLYAPLNAEVEILKSAGLGKNDAKALQMVGVAQPYFGAIAISPEDGLMSESTVAAANYHDTDAASAAALTEPRPPRPWHLRNAMPRKKAKPIAFWRP